MTIALAVRLPFVDDSGLPSDIGLFTVWSDTAVNKGLAGLYARDDYNYLPVASYIFVGAGHLQRDILDRPFSPDSAGMRIILKLPAILADLAITAILYLFLTRRSSDRVAIAGGLAYALNPAIIHDSMIWGQWDAVVALPMLLATICLIASSPVLAVIFLTIAILIKLQAIVLIPLVAVVIQRQSGWHGLFMPAMSAIATAGLMLMPVIVSGQLRRSIEIYAGLTHSQPWLSSNAYNLWWLVNWLQSGRPETTLTGSEALIGPIDYKTAALTVYALSVAGIVAALARASLTRETISLSAAGSVIAFFALAPEMHERYLLPALPLLILAFDARLQRWLVAILSLTLFLNLDWVLRSAEGASASRLQLAATGLLALINLAALIWIGVELFQRATRRRSHGRWGWLGGATAMLAVAALTGVTVLRWYIRDAHG